LEGRGKRKNSAEPFVGDSIVDLSRFILRRMFEQLDEGFAHKPTEEKERIAANIAQRLAIYPRMFENALGPKPGSQIFPPKRLCGQVGLPRSAAQWLQPSILLGSPPTPASHHSSTRRRG
jgi:hypothetical protein